MTDIAWVVFYFVVACLGFAVFIISVYVSARAASVGWHKSKQEYLERLRKLRLGDW